VARPATATGSAGGYEREVADLGGVAAPAPEDVAVDGDAGADARREREVDGVLGTVGESPLAADAGHGVVLEGDGCIRALAERVDEGDTLGRDVRRVDDRARVDVERADTPDTDGIEVPGSDGRGLTGRLERGHHGRGDGRTVGLRGRTAGTATLIPIGAGDQRPRVRRPEVDGGVTRHADGRAPGVHQPFHVVTGHAGATSRSGSRGRPVSEATSGRTRWPRAGRGRRGVAVSASAAVVVRFGRDRVLERLTEVVPRVRISHLFEGPTDVVGVLHLGPGHHGDVYGPAGHISRAELSERDNSVRRRAVSEFDAGRDQLRT
jgi:hypothetical protein